MNPDLNYVEINMGSRTSPSGEELEPAFIVADEALVALELEMTVFNVEREEHASRIARKEIGKQLENIPLEVLSVDVIDDEDDAAAEDDADTAAGDDAEPTDGDEADTSKESDVDTTAESEHSEEVHEDDDVLPEFEDLIE